VGDEAARLCDLTTILKTTCLGCCDGSSATDAQGQLAKGSKRGREVVHGRDGGRMLVAKSVSGFCAHTILCRPWSGKGLPIALTKITDLKTGVYQMFRTPLESYSV
jgi:hypothetical protein